MRAKKSLGQNFLIDNFVIEKIVNEVSADKNDLIIEIGPGHGALTKLLQRKESFLICYEIDKDLINELKQLENSKTKIINQNILDSQIKNDIKDISYNNLFIIGNLPYYITTPIIEYIVNQKLDFKKMTIMVQKEVADRFMANPKTKEYGYFTLFLKYYFDIERVCDVIPTSFIPAPKVNSTVINLIPKKLEEDINENKYFSFLKEVFGQKRKTLKNNLKAYNWEKIKKVLEKYQFDDNVRAEELSDSILIEIFKNI